MPIEFNFDLCLASSIGVVGSGIVHPNGDVRVVAQFVREHSKEAIDNARRRLNRVDGLGLLKKARPSIKAIESVDCFCSMNMGFALQTVVASAALKQVFARAYKSVLGRAANFNELTQDKAILREFVEEAIPEALAAPTKEKKRPSAPKKVEVQSKVNKKKTPSATKKTEDKKTSGKKVEIPKVSKKAIAKKKPAIKVIRKVAGGNKKSSVK